MCHIIPSHYLLAHSLLRDTLYPLGLAVVCMQHCCLYAHCLLSWHSICFTAPSCCRVFVVVYETSAP